MDRFISMGRAGAPGRLLRLGVLAVAGALAGTAGPAGAAQSVFDTGRVLEYTGSECVGQPRGSCVTLSSKRLRIAARASRQIVLACDAAHPYLIGWDSEQHEHLRLVLASPQPTMAKGRPAAARPQAVTVVALNQADTSGFAKLFIGCSRRPWQGSPFMTSREAVPRNHVGFTGGRS